MADNIRKFLDQAGVSTLWGEVAKLELTLYVL